MIRQKQKQCREPGILAEYVLSEERERETKCLLRSFEKLSVHIDVIMLYGCSCVDKYG